MAEKTYLTSREELESVVTTFETRFETVETQIESKPDSIHDHDASHIVSGALSSDILPVVPITKGGTGSITASGARATLGLNIDGIEVVSSLPSDASTHSRTLYLVTGA